MTDRTREELVEKAADAMFTANDGQFGQGYDEMARAALAVFEQYTPGSPSGGPEPLEGT